MHGQDSFSTWVEWDPCTDYVFSSGWDGWYQVHSSDDTCIGAHNDGEDFYEGDASSSTGYESASASCSGETGDSVSGSYNGWYADDDEVRRICEELIANTIPDAPGSSNTACLTGCRVAGVQRSRSINQAAAFLFPFAFTAAALAGCVAASEDAWAPPAEMKKTRVIEFVSGENGTLVQDAANPAAPAPVASATYALGLPIETSRGATFKGWREWSRLSDSSTQLFVLKPEAVDVFPVVNNNFAPPRYETRYQDKAAGEDRGTCLVANATHPCPPRILSHNLTKSEFGLFGKSFELPEGRSWMILLVHNRPFVRLQLNVSEDVSIGPWILLPSTARVLFVDDVDADYQDIQHCHTAVCGEIENGQVDFTPPDSGFSAYSFFILAKGNAQIEACFGGPRDPHCLSRGPVLTAVDGRDALDYGSGFFVRPDTSSFERLVVNAQSFTHVGDFVFLFRLVVWTFDDPPSLRQLWQTGVSPGTQPLSAGVPSVPRHVEGLATSVTHRPASY